MSPEQRLEALEIALEFAERTERNQLAHESGSLNETSFLEYVKPRLRSVCNNLGYEIDFEVPVGGRRFRADAVVETPRNRIWIEVKLSKPPLAQVNNWTQRANEANYKFLLITGNQQFARRFKAARGSLRVVSEGEDDISRALQDLEREG